MGDCNSCFVVFKIIIDNNGIFWLDILGRNRNIRVNYIYFCSIDK